MDIRYQGIMVMLAMVMIFKVLNFYKISWNNLWIIRFVRFKIVHQRKKTREEGRKEGRKGGVREGRKGGEVEGQVMDKCKKK